MAEDTRVKIRLTKAIQGYGRLFPQGEILEARIDPYGKVTLVAGICVLPIDLDAWELVLPDADLEQWLAV